LVGEPESEAPAGIPPRDEEISAGDYPHPVTMPLLSAGKKLRRNLGFPGLRRFRQWRRLDHSQLLQIATLAYI
jgi:hypothetical protein